MRRRQRRSLLFLFLILCLEGCKDPGTEKTADTSSDYKISEDNFFADKDFSSHLNISIAYWNIDEMANRTQADEIQTYIEKKFNITIEPVSVSWTNYTEYYQMLDATDSLPDVFSTVTLSSNDPNGSSVYEKYISSGTVRSIPEDLSDYPNLQSLFEEVSDTVYDDGKFYCIPRLVFTDPILSSSDAALIVRRDWMNTLGISDPQNIEEFISMVTAFAKDDPDGNGLDDTIGYNVNNLIALGKWLMLSVAPECNTYTWIERDGAFVPSWTTEEFRQVVSIYRRLHESGGLDPEFYTKSPAAVMEDFGSGRLGALEFKSSASSLAELEDYWNTENGDFDECVDILHIFPASDGTCYSNSSSLFWSESFISSDVNDEKMERILCLYEYLLSDEGQRLTTYGIENEDYQILDDGSYVFLLDIGDDSWDSVLKRKYPSINLFSNLASRYAGWDDFEDTPQTEMRYGKHCVELAVKDITWNQENTTQVERPYAFMLYPKENTEIFSTSNAFNSFVKCIIGTEDPLQMWDSVMEEFKEEGLDDYILRQNEDYRKSQEAS